MKKVLKSIFNNWHQQRIAKKRAKIEDLWCKGLISAEESVERIAKLYSDQEEI